MQPVRELCTRCKEEPVVESALWPDLRLCEFCYAEYLAEYEWENMCEN